MTSDDRKGIEKKFDAHTEEIVNLRIVVEGLTIKSGVWGLIGGSIPVVVLLAFVLIRGNS